MNTALERTHRKFGIEPVKWFDVIRACKSNFGDTNFLDQYHTRPWITDGYTLFIRQDLLDDSFITYLGLVCKIKQST
jgi:hypothetical protein